MPRIVKSEALSVLRKGGLLLIVLAFAMALGFWVGQDLLAADRDSSGGTSTGICQAWPWDCGSFTCTNGWIADNGICLLKAGYCVNEVLNEKKKMHDCSTYLW